MRGVRWVGDGSGVRGGHAGHDDEGQDPHQHERHGDDDDGRHHDVVALIRAEQAPHATPHSVRGPPHVQHGGRGAPLLCQAQAADRGQSGVLGLGGDGDAAGFAFGRRVLQQQLPLAAFEAHGQRPLHLRRQLVDDDLVVAKAGQVPAVRQLGQLAAHGAGQGLDLRGGHVDASEALQAEGVAARQQLGRLEDVVVGAEAHVALRVLLVVFIGTPVLPIPLLTDPSPGVLAPASRTPLPVVPVPFAPPPSLHLLRVRTPGPSHLQRPFLPPVVLLADLVLFPVLVGFGFDILRRRSGSRAPFARAPLLVTAHDGVQRRRLRRDS